MDGRPRPEAGGCGGGTVAALKRAKQLGQQTPEHEPPDLTVEVRQGRTL